MYMLEKTNTSIWLKQRNYVKKKKKQLNTKLKK